MNSEERAKLLEKLEALLYHEKRDWAAALALLTDWEREIRLDEAKSWRNDNLKRGLDAEPHRERIAKLSRPAEKGKAG